MSMKWLALALRGAESLKVTYTAQADDKFQVVVVPVLKGEPANLSEEGKKIRALLATPLVITASAADLEHGLDEKLLALAQAREEVADSFDEVLAAMKDSGKKAANLAAKATAAAKKPQGGAAGKKDADKGKKKGGDKVKASAPAADDDEGGDEEKTEEVPETSPAPAPAASPAPAAAPASGGKDLFAEG